ncbi:MAG: hypothetical protein WAS55_08830 [Saprospiraceae bacterium]
MKKYILFAMILFSFCNVKAQQLYNVTVGFQSLKCLKVVEGPFDDAEDIMYRSFLRKWSYMNASSRRQEEGNITFRVNTSDLSQIMLFSQNVDKAIQMAKNNTFNTKSRTKTILRKISLNELASLSIWVEMQMWDTEFLAHHFDYEYCPDCISNTNIKEIALLAYIDFCRNLIKGESRTFPIAVDYYENNSTSNSSHIQAKFYITIDRVK